MKISPPNNAPNRYRLLPVLPACLIMTGAWTMLLAAGGSNLPTADEIKDLQSKYKAELKQLIDDGADKQFLPELFQKADAFAKRGAEALKKGRLLQAEQAFYQARWQLPYRGPAVPKHVHRILGNLRLRHSGGINDVEYSPNGKYMATASDDRSVRIWNLANGHEIGRYVGHGDAVRTIDYTSDGKLMASAGGDNYIKLWNPETGKTVRTLKSDAFYVTSIVFSPDDKYLFSAWDDRSIRVFDVKTGDVKRTIGDFKLRVNSLTFSPDGKIFGAASADGQVRLWQYPRMIENLNQPAFWSFRDLQGASYHLAFGPDGLHFARCYSSGIYTYKLNPSPGAAAPSVTPDRRIPMPQPLPGHRFARFNCSLYSKDGKILFTGATDGMIRLYDVATGEAVGTLRGHNDGVQDLTWNNDVTQLASASSDHTIRLWPFEVVSQSREFVGHSGSVWMSSFSPDASLIVSASADRTIGVWDARTGKLERALKGHESPVTVAMFSPDGTKILSAAGDHKMILWDAATGKVLNTFEGHDSTITAVDIRSDGKQIVSGDADETIKIWDVGTGKATMTIDNAGAIVTSIAYHPNGAKFASAHVDKIIRLWDVKTGRETNSWIAHGESVSAIAFNTEGTELASCGADGLVKVWNVSAPEDPPLVFSGHDGPLTSVAFRPDGKYVASGGSDQVVKVWKLEDGNTKQASRDFRGHANWVTSVQFSRDGYYVTSASIDKNVRLWELTSKELPLLSEHTGAVKAVAISPDGKTLASAATDQTIKIWDLVTGTEKMTLEGHDEHALALAFTPDGNTLISSGSDRDIHLWNVATGQKAPPKGTMQNLKQPAPLLSVLPDGKRLMAWTPEGSFSTKVRIYDLSSGAELMEGTDSDRNVVSASFSKSGDRIALGGADGIVRVFDVQGNRMTKRSIKEKDENGKEKEKDWIQFDNAQKVNSVALTPDGALVIAGSEDGTIKIADAEMKKVLRTFKGHSTNIRDCVVSPDGKRFATSGDDNVIKLWDIATGKELRQWDIIDPEQIDRNFTPQVKFTPGGEHLVTANANTTIYVLDLP